jgi:AraC-like DNA-binding protein
MQLEKPDFTNLLYLLANNFKAKVSDHQFTVNPAFGTGYCWSEQLPSGITIMVSDTCLKESLTVACPERNNHFFTLQFDEEAPCETELTEKNKKNAQEYESFVKLNHTLFPEIFVFPAVKRLRSVKFFFNEDHLSSLLGKQAFEEVLARYFPLEMKSENQEPIATEYRVMLDELWTEKITQPLKLNYIQNRVSLLLEKYLVKLYARRKEEGKKVRRTGDETLRLMKVEALLVKNFTVNPPTIDELARISAMSPTKLKNDFKTLYGFPIYEYFQKNRMLKAKSLLVLGKYTIKEIGQMVGYSNLSHFANTFKKEFGFLPSEIAAKGGVLVYCV